MLKSRSLVLPRCVVALLPFVVVPVAQAQASRVPVTRSAADGGPRHSDDKKHPLGAEQRERRRAALREAVATGRSVRVSESTGGGYVELEQSRNDRVFMLLVEFGDEEHPLYPSELLGPRHNQIVEPDRAVDNSTIWQPDFDTAHYTGVLDRMNEYFRRQSSGRYALDGEVTGWVKARYSAPRYGRDEDGDATGRNSWPLISDGIESWVAARCAEGMTEQQIHDYLATFDVWDRYDYDGDGNFDEPDGYIDHFLIVHAGEGQETGGGAQGDDAIWSHRWFAYYDLEDLVGPPGNLHGGTEIGHTGIWIGDYTIQPENGGLGVFAHEYSHDLGLPDEYDTEDGENSTGFWTLMSSGSYLGDGTIDIGSRPGDLNAWDKLQLGWLTFASASAGETSTHSLGPAEYNTDLPQALVVNLPERTRTLELADPPEGELAWWSGRGNDLDNAMVHAIDVPAMDPTLEMSLWYDTEEGWDYAYVAVSADAGTTWTNLAGNVTSDDNSTAANEGNGISGTSEGWVAASFDLGDYAGENVLIRLRYVTDGAVTGKGVLADAIRVVSDFDEAAESLDDWTLFGFSETTGTEVSTTFNAYIAEHRQYISYDEGLRTGPYNFGFLSTLPNWVERFPYQNGLLISYWDEYHTDNNTSTHPGEGLILPVDAHPDQLLRPDGLPWRARIQTYDATFGSEPTEAISVHLDGVESSQPSLPAVPVFDDLESYYRPLDSAEWSPGIGVAVPRTGTRIQVLDEPGPAGGLQVRVEPSVF